MEQALPGRHAAWSVGALAAAMSEAISASHATGAARSSTFVHVDALSLRVEVLVDGDSAADSPDVLAADVVSEPRSIRDRILDDLHGRQVAMLRITVRQGGTPPTFAWVRPGDPPPPNRTDMPQ